MLDPITRQHVEKATEALQDEFAGTFSRETISRYIGESVGLLGDSKINVFVPVLAHRFARERLKALGQAEGLIEKLDPEVLFVCVHNAGRSQMAAGLVKLRTDASTSAPPVATRLRRSTRPSLEAMDELGVDMTEDFPKPLTDEVVRAADVVITMGCGDACPILPRQEVRGLGTRPASETAPAFFPTESEWRSPQRWVGRTASGRSSWHGWTAGRATFSG
jgi:arsenate reductase (thioredoxin)